MSLLSVADCRALVPTPLDDTQLAAVITRIEGELTARLGTYYVDDSTTITERVAGGRNSITLKRPLKLLVSVTEYAALSSASGTVLTENSEYFAWKNEGRLQRLGQVTWGASVAVEYVPADQNHLWRRAIADLVRVTLSQTALASEQVAGEYSYQAPANWETEFQRVVRRLSFVGV